MTHTDADLRRKNKRLAITFGLFALFVFLTSFPFWMGIFKTMGDQTL